MSTACDISLSIWLSQSFGSTCPVLGVSILWWGRIGKLLQFIGGITILLELIGVERVQAYGNELYSSVSQLEKLSGELLGTILRLAGSVLRVLISTATWKLFPTFINNIDIGYSVVTANLSKFNHLTALNLSSRKSVEKLTFNIFRFSYILSLLLVTLVLFGSLRINKEFFNSLLENGVAFSELIQAILGILLGFSMILLIFYVLNLLSILFSLALIFVLLCCRIILGVIGQILNFFIICISKLLKTPNLDKFKKWLAFVMFILGSVLDFIVS